MMIRTRTHKIDSKVILDQIIKVRVHNKRDNNTKLKLEANKLPDIVN